MLLLRACLLWFLVSANIVGGAFIFRRLFPRESPWLGFVVPEIAFVLVCNFIEYQVALTFLGPLFIVTTFAGLWAICSSRHLWRVMRLPSLIFLGVFAFTLLLRYLKPSIPDVRDGLPDLSLISAFCMGQTLPVDSTWIPPIKLVHYYFLEHYAASLVVRLFSLDIGTGFNICSALLNSYIYFFTAGAAWHLSRGKLWVTLLTIFMTVCAGTGATGYLWLASGKHLDPEDVINIYNRLGDPNYPIALFKYLTPIPSSWDQHELMVPGYWSWMGCFHSAETGQMLMAFCIFSLVELLRRKSVNWPWICLAISPLLLLPTCSWGMPLAALFFLSGLFACWRIKIVPQDWRLVVLVSLTAGLCLSPMLINMFLWDTPSITLATGLHTEVAEFLSQWWPVYLPWFLLFFIWKRLHAATKIALILVPLAFALIETFNVGQRYDMTGKSWGITFCAGWMVFVPVLASQRALLFRLVLLLLIISSGLSFCYWTTYYWNSVDRKDIAHLEGTGPLRQDILKARLLEAVSLLKHQTILCGKSSWAFCESAALAHFTENRPYVTWSIFADAGFYTNGLGEAWNREVPTNELYDGKCDNPLFFLRQRNIAAMVIYPDDNIPDAVIEKLKQQLSPYYSYEDAHEPNRHQVPPCAGIFVFHPELIHYPPGILTPPADAPAAAIPTPPVPAPVTAIPAPAQ